MWVELVVYKDLNENAKAIGCGKEDSAGCAVCPRADQYQ